MSTFKITGKMLTRCINVNHAVRQFSTSLACQKNPLFGRNRFFSVDMEENKRPEKTLKERTSALNVGYPTGNARRLPYKRPEIRPWKTHKEIPHHYREGVNKELLVPTIKKKHIKKYKNIYEERPHYRTAFQRLLNKGKALIPYDKNMPVITGKHTGPGVEGGSNLAQKLGALHLVQPTGYIDKHGNFKPVKEMVPEFVVPKLDDFKLKPYVPYRATNITQSKVTARSLYIAFYAEEAKQRFEEETGVKPVIDTKPKESKLSKWLPRKKDT